MQKWDFRCSVWKNGTNPSNRCRRAGWSSPRPCPTPRSSSSPASRRSSRTPRRASLKHLRWNVINVQQSDRRPLNIWLSNICLREETYQTETQKTRTRSKIVARIANYMTAHISKMKLSAWLEVFCIAVAYNQHLGVLYVLARVFYRWIKEVFLGLTGSVYKLFEFLSEMYCNFGKRSFTTKSNKESKDPKCENIRRTIVLLLDYGAQLWVSVLSNNLWVMHIF